LHFALARSPRQRTSAARGKYVEQHGGIVCSDGADLAGHRRALISGEPVEGSRVQDQPETAADIGVLKVGHVALHQPHVNAGLPYPLTATVQRFVHQVYAGHLPAALGQLDAPDGASAAQVKRAPVRRLASALLALEQLGELVCERWMLGEVLPGVETESVEQPVGNAHPVLLEA